MPALPPVTIAILPSSRPAILSLPLHDGPMLGHALPARATANSGPPPMHPILAALAVRNYQLFVGGGLISLIGTWMQRIGVGWLMWELTHSGTWLGLAAMADLFPTVVVGPVAGAVADRVDRLR